MRFKDQVHFIRRNMKKNKLRVFMTILATTMACSFLIILSSVGFGLQKSMTENIMSQGIITEIAIKGQKNAKEVTEKDLSEFKTHKNVKSIIERTTVYDPVVIRYKNLKANNLSLIFTNMKEEHKSKMKLDQGRMPEANNEIVVGYDFASQLWTDQEIQSFDKQIELGKDTTTIKQPKGYTGNILNKTINVEVPKIDSATGKQKTDKNIQLIIVGIKEKPKQSWETDSDILVNRDIKGFENYIDNARENKNINNSLVVNVDKFDNVEKVTNDLIDEGFYVRSVTTVVEDINVFFNVFKIGLIFVGAIAVLISAIGIFNTMTMAVTERVQEIGIMKAIGASPSVVRKMFLMESMYIGFIGSILGIVISYIISYAINLIVPKILSAIEKGASPGSYDITFSYIPISLVIIAVVICSGVATLSGLNPAIKATRIKVLSALRKEI
ncbi:ABC transporter permease [Bacillus inaquosorum]|uniref:ABC transporter permease n=1 Tax=Bacillus inaquosorum TaxID=483913 RepID=UPI0034D00517